MKPQTRLINTAILVLIFGMIVMSISAQDNYPGHGKNKSNREQPPPPPPPPPVPPSGEGMNEAQPRLDLPDLTPEQYDKIRKADLKNMSDLTPLKNQMREKHARLSTILTTIPLDQKQADQLADEIGKTAAAILKAQIRHDQELRNILTPDQQIIFDSRPKPWLNKRR